MASGRLAFQRSSRTAQGSNEHLGWAQVTHPFHPLRGQSFEVLKTRRVAGVDTVILRHPGRGTWAVAREWTDWAEPSAEPPPGQPQARLEPWQAIELAVLVEQLRSEGIDK